MSSPTKFPQRLALLRQLVLLLPANFQPPFLEVLDELQADLVTVALAGDKIRSAMGDLSLELKAMQFDLESTRNELEQERNKPK